MKEMKETKECERCEKCKKRIRLISFACKCKYRMLCNTCKQPEVHGCDFDYRSEEKDRLSKTNPRITTEKMEKI